VRLNKYEVYKKSVFLTCVWLDGMEVHSGTENEMRLLLVIIMRSYLIIRRYYQTFEILSHNYEKLSNLVYNYDLQDPHFFHSGSNGLTHPKKSSATARCPRDRKRSRRPLLQVFPVVA